MEVIFAIPLYCLPVVLPFFAGAMASSIGRSYKFWFWASVPLPLITHFILLAMPAKKENN